MQTKKVTEEKLNSTDYYRIQMQLKKRKDKLRWSTMYNFIAERYPHIAERIRDDGVSQVMKRLEADFRTMIDSNPNIEEQFNEWLKERVANQHLIQELYLISK